MADILESVGRKMIKPFNGNAPLAWVATIGFVIAASWPDLSESELPLMGLRGVTAPLVGWPLTIVTFIMAVFLSLPRFLSRERLLVCAGFSLCLFLVVAFHVSPVAGLLLGFIAANIIRQSGALKSSGEDEGMVGPHMDNVPQGRDSV